VLVSKYRRQIFNEGSFAYFKEVMKEIREKMPEITILIMNHDKDHIHLRQKQKETSRFFSPIWEDSSNF
jgi:REP element-mobilizing transposase RayT